MPLERMRVGINSDSASQTHTPGPMAKNAMKQNVNPAVSQPFCVLGTGVNPGFVMDVLPVCLTGVCRSVQAVHVQRVVNAATRRGPLQKKIGSGLPPAEFEKLFSEGKAGHAGLKESAALLREQARRLAACEALAASMEAAPIPDKSDLCALARFDQMDLDCQQLREALGK